jgi:uncharacterized protein
MGAPGESTASHEVDTPLGSARVALTVPSSVPTALVVLGHGAGGGVDAPDLALVTGALSAAGIAVARVEQPYRVAGRRLPGATAGLDTAWRAVVAHLLADPALAPLPLVFGGRSSGARVACRTASPAGSTGNVVGVVALAFPLVPPRRPSARPRRGGPAPSRAPELLAAAAAVPVLVVQGERDPFGSPAEVSAAAAGTGVEVLGVPGDHSLRSGRPAAVPEEVGAAVVAAVRAWSDVPGPGLSGIASR